MGIRERLQRKITVTALQLQSILIVTLLGTILLLKIWPRFYSDAMSLDWPVYLVLVGVFAVPLFRRE